MGDLKPPTVNYKREYQRLRRLTSNIERKIWVGKYNFVFIIILVAISLRYDTTFLTKYLFKERLHKI